MPTYDYRCQDCGYELEVQQSFDDDPLTECPSCAGPLKKRFGVPGIAFKGSGFYKTDSRGGSAASKSSSSDSSSSSKPASTGSNGSSGSSGGGSDSSSTSTSSSGTASTASAAPASA